MDEHTRDSTVAPPPDGRSPIGWTDVESTWEHATLRRALVHGVRLLNDGAAHEAHDCFEAEWYNYANGTVESAFLHGLVQVAAGIHKRHTSGDEAGMRSLFDSARGYLDPVPEGFYGLDVSDVRDTIEVALDDAGVIEDWRLTLDGDQPVATAADYRFAASVE